MELLILHNLKESLAQHTDTIHTEDQMKSHLLFMIFFCLLLSAKNIRAADIYATSIVALGELREVENLYFRHLTNYVNLLQEKMQLLHEYIKTIKHDNLKQRLKYVANPLNSFRLVHRAPRDWFKWLTYIKYPTSLLKDMDKLVAQAPTKVDMEEALMGMERIERFYGLKAADIAKGFVGSKQFGNQMSAPECLMLAEFLYNKTEYFRAAQWYRLVLFYEKQPDNPVQRKFYGINTTEIRKMFLKSRIMEAMSYGNVEAVP